MAASATTPGEQPTPPRASREPPWIALDVDVGAQELLRAVACAADLHGDAVFVLDRDGHVLHAGRHAERLLQGVPVSAAPAWLGAVFRRAAHTVFESGGSTHFEVYHPRQKAAWWAEVRRADTVAVISLRDVSETARTRALLDGQRRVLELITLGVPLPATIDVLARLLESQDPARLACLAALDVGAGRARILGALSMPAERYAALEAALPELLRALRDRHGDPSETVVLDVAAQPSLARVCTALALGEHEACLAAPLFGPPGAPRGALILHGRSSGVDDADTALLDWAARLASLALDRALRDAPSASTGDDAPAPAAVLAATATGLACVDAELRCVRVNSAFTALTGARAGASLGASAAEFPGVTALEAACRAVLESGRVDAAPSEVDAGQSAVPGGRRRCALACRPLRDAAENVRWLVVSLADVSDADKARRLAREHGAELEAELRLRDEFFSIASHEIRAPLTALALHAQTLRRAARREGPGALTPEALAHRLEAVEAQSRRLVKLVERLLDVSRVATGHVALEPEEMDLAALAREVVARHADELSARGYTLRLHADTPVVGRWDRLRLDEVLTNLLTNAIKYGQSRPIDFTVAPSGTGARVEVCDHGVGIPRDSQARVFDAFERGVSPHDAASLGLGLYIVRGIVAAHGGTIAVRSEPGEGATFVVHLPAAPPEPSSD